MRLIVAFLFGVIIGFAGTVILGAVAIFSETERKQ